MTAADRDPASSKCFAKALRFLAHREHSRAEMSQKLKRAEYSDPVIEETIGKLERLKYVDDTRLARQITTAAAQRKFYGRRRAMVELTRRGIANEVAQQAVRDIYSLVDSTALAHALAKKHVARLSRLDPQTARRRLAGLLQRRGFDGEAVGAVINQSFGHQARGDTDD